MAGVVVRRGLRVLKWLAIGLVALVALLLVVGAIWEQVSRADEAKRYPPRGQIVDIGGRRFHLDCRGSGSPTVILESGLDINGTLAWYKVQDTIAKTTRVCSSDRAGIMWSDPPPHVQNGDHVAQDLHAALSKAGIGGPLVLVGHSLGGPYIMNYTRQFGGDVAGLVFVDASHPDQLDRLPAPGKPRQSTALPFAMRAVAALSWAGVPRLMMSGSDEVPKEISEARGAQIGRSLHGALAEGAALPVTLAQGGQLRTLGNRPIVVLTAMKPYPESVLKAQKMTPADGLAQQARWKAMQDDEARWSTRSRHQLVPDASHYIQIDRPDVVIRAVDEVVATVRADAAKATEQNRASVAALPPASGHVP
ncbi:MAG: alpha/beta hydrolase [Sphingomonas sp.]